MFADLQRVVGIGVGVHAVTLVLIKFSGLVPGCTALRFLRVRYFREFSVCVEIQIFLGSTERQMWSEDAECQKERLVVFLCCKGFKLLDCLVGADAIRVDMVRTLISLK